MNTVDNQPQFEAVIVGGGIAGLSAAIYLGRALRNVAVIDGGHSMARWEPAVENYLGFPAGVRGDALLDMGRTQARRFGAIFIEDEIREAKAAGGGFLLKGKEGLYKSETLLLATGIFHRPPDIPAVSECLGKSMFFCKDCDGCRIRGKRVAVFGAGNETVEYALGLLAYSRSVLILPNGDKPCWDPQHAVWLREYDIRVSLGRVERVKHADGFLNSVFLDNGVELPVDCIFTVRGDEFHAGLAEQLGAGRGPLGQVKVNNHLQTSVPRLYAAGCITGANCQMVIAAGQGAAAAQAMNRFLFEQSLKTHSLMLADATSGSLLISKNPSICARAADIISGS